MRASLAAAAPGNLAGLTYPSSKAELRFRRDGCLRAGAYRRAARALESGRRVRIGARHRVLAQGPARPVQNEDARAIVDACNRAGVRLMTAFPMRFAPATARMAASVAADEIGPVRAVSAVNQGQIPTRHRAWFGDRQLAELYRSSTLMALSRIEGFGLPPVEALLAGGRVIAAREPIYEEVLGDAACYAAEASPDAIAEAMLIATQTTPPIAARRRLETRFSWRATADALLGAYRAAQNL